MKQPRAAAVTALVVVLLLAALYPCLALGDGDPASDVLLGQDVFLPYSSISAAVQHQLYSTTEAARRAGYPLKIALIAGRSDLGVIPSLFNQPSRYAQFLSAELNGVVPGPVLVVMPAGFGLALQGKAQSTGSLAGLRIAPGADGLGAAAVLAARRVAAASGHPLGSVSSAGVGARAG